MTPSRVNRGLQLLGIDTKTSLTRSTTASIPNSWPTPPLSAPDSRRESPAFSCFSDAPHSGSSSVAPFSIPATSPAMLNHGNNASSTQISHYEGSRPGLTNNLNDVPVQSSTPGGDIPYSDLHLNECGHGADYSMVVRTAAIQGASDVATASHNASLGVRNIWLTANDLYAEQSTSPSFYCHPAQSFHSMPTDPFYPTHSATQGTNPAIYGQTSQGAVSSRIPSVDEWSDPQFLACADSGNGRESFHDGFYSTDSEIGHYELNNPHSPEDVYFGGIGEDADVVQSDDPRSTPQNWSVLARPAGITKGLPLRPRKRPLRRGKSSVQRTTLPNFDYDIVLEGAWRVNGDYYVPDRCASANKKFVCGHKDENGHQCGRRFERAEHLKRHQSSHCEKRKYQCPLGGCRTTKGISRGDNAGDHFKTHLKLTNKGRRNKPIEWPVLRDLLLVDWEEKEAIKMISKLEKWICIDPEGANQRHWVEL